jgi:ATP-dependent Lon protease
MKLGKIQLNPRELPVLPLRDILILPNVIVPFFVSKESSRRALDEAMGGDRNIFIVFQKGTEENPGLDDIHPVGTISHILQVLKLPDGNTRVLVEGKTRASLLSMQIRKDINWGQYEPLPEDKTAGKEVAALMQSIQGSFKEYARLKGKIPREVFNTVMRADTPDKLISHICTFLPNPLEQKLPFLLTVETLPRLDELAILLETENQLLSLKEDINTRVRKRIEKSQKDYFLNEQMKEIQKELGPEQEDPNAPQGNAGGGNELENKLKSLNLPEEVRQKADQESKRLARLQPMSPESGILRTYLEWIADLPWNIHTGDRKDIQQAAKILDEDHYDLKNAKERILDFIAIRQLQEAVKGPILCFVGPPGTGKTSLGRSVARALDRKFVRISLGGVRDEAEIRGHRKTYVGALPGKIIQSLKKAGSCNPVFLLDEIDKISTDYRGDPASALLEVLDPEQNATFVDHYMEVPFDLSKVMFITTANSVHSIPLPLLDRMEVIEIPGYTEYEKKKIAQDFIIPKQKIENGLDKADIRFEEKALGYLIQNYTLESGVRNLEREIGKIIRKIAREGITEYQSRPGRYRIHSDTLHENTGTTGYRITPENDTPDLKDLDFFVTEERVKQFLGKERYSENDLNKELRCGIAVGMAWTEAGGRILPVEATLLEGDGKLLLTGKLGDVMKESAQIALSFIKANTTELGIASDFYKGKDIHIHVPEGAIPKDGPSAGITMTAALVSAIKKIPLIKSVSMTGEITLTDRLLPIGGVKEKVLAAHRHGIKTVLLPKKNKRDKDDLPDEVRNTLKFHFADSVKEALTKLFPAGTF